MESEVMGKGVTSEGVRSSTPGDPLQSLSLQPNTSYCMNCSSPELQNRTMTPHCMATPPGHSQRAGKDPPGDFQQIPQKNRMIVKEL